MSEQKEMTAVEWLVKKLDKNFDYVGETIIEQAKRMEKQQIVDSHLTGLIHPLETDATKQAEQYYNDKYGKQ